MGGTKGTRPAPGNAVDNTDTDPAGELTREQGITAAPETTDRMREAVETAEAARRAGGLGRPGKAMDRRSPFYIGMTAAAGVAVTYGLVELLVRARSVLILIGLALFIAAGLDPVVGWLTRLGLPRWAAVLVVVGNVITSLIAGAGTFLWMLALGIPYPLLLGLLVAILDLIPVIGSTIGGIIVTLVALTVSLPVAIGTLIFYVGYRLAEDYLIVPRIIGRTVRVPAIVSLIAVVIGGVLLGIVGALIAIPAAAAISLLLDEITFRRLDSS